MVQQTINNKQFDSAKIPLFPFLTSCFYNFFHFFIGCFYNFFRYLVRNKRPLLAIDGASTVGGVGPYIVGGMGAKSCHLAYKGA